MSFAIRVPTAADVAEIAELHVSSWRETYGHLLPADYLDAEHVAARHRMWERILGGPAPDLTVRVAERDASIVGFALAGAPMPHEGETSPREVQLYALYVAAAHHGSGAGQALLEASIGSGPAMLWVAKENPRAIAFYQRNGFRFDGVEQRDPGAPSITDARMVR